MQTAENQVLLVINSGSSSLKFSISSIASPPQVLYRGQITSIGKTGNFQVDNQQGDRQEEQPITVADHEQAVLFLLEWLDRKAATLDIVVAGHRVVHGGERYHAPERVTDEVMAYLHSLIPLAHNHQPACRALLLCRN